MIELVVGNNLNKVFKNVVAKIENSSSLDLENFVIVPDRLSLFAEKEIFSILNLTSSFNIKVLGISKLQNYFAPKIETLLGDESRLLIYSILKENNFEFIKPSFEIATEIFKIISQLKSSNVLAGEFLKNAQSQKLQEIGKIFEIYEAKKTKADQSDILNNIANNLDLEKISKLNFYICGFDNLTSQAFKVVEKILKFGKKVVVGATFPEDQKNYKVYDNDIYQKVVRFCNENKIEFVKTFVNLKEESQASHILTNLFSYSPKHFETNKVHLLEFETPESEISEIAKTIRFYVKNKNFMFSNFNVLSGNLESFANDFATIFEIYDIPYYIDLGQKIQNLPIFSFFKNFFEFVQTSSEENLFELLISPYVNVSKSEVQLLKNEIDFNGGLSVEVINKFNNIKELLDIINCFKEKISKCSNLQEFSKIVDEIVNLFSLRENNEKIIASLENDLKTQKIYLQVFNKLEVVLNVLKSEDEASFESCLTVFLKLFGEQEIKGVPLSVDCVFIGGENSFFEERKVMFLSNASYGTLPKTSKDLGLFSDDDIGLLALDIQPTIRMINRRNKQKLLFNLSQGEELFVSTSGSELGEKTEKSVLFYELQKIFTFKNKPLKILNNFYSFMFDDEKYLEFKVQTKQDFNREVLKFKDQISKEEIKFLIGENYLQEEKIALAKELYNHFSPTEIEKFFQCPFKHFFYYGIRIKENSVCKFDARDFGNYFHILAENFVKRNLGKIGELSDEEIRKELNEIEKVIKKESRFERLLKNQTNNSTFALLKKEGKVLLENIRKEQKFSNFVASFFEQFFELKTPLSKIVGVVDRIDVCDNMFRVVDYKTGETKKSLRAVFEGVELQLFIYLLAISKKLNFEPVGGFYFSIGTDFNKEKTSKNKMEGFVVGENQIIKALDKRFGNKKESDIVSLKLTSGSTVENLVLSTKKNVLTKEGFFAICKYVELLIEKAEKEIFSGEIPAKPLGEEACLNCPLFSICSFKQNTFEKERKLGKEIQETEFIRIVENGKN